MYENCAVGHGSLDVQFVGRAIVVVERKYLHGQYPPVVIKHARDLKLVRIYH